MLGGVLSVVIFSFEGCSEDFMYLFFSFFLRYIFLVHEVLSPFIDIHCTYFLFYIVDVCFFFSHTISCVVSFLSLYTCFLLFVCNLLAINSLFAKFFKSLC